MDKSRMWTIIDGTKYDISDFVSWHPGGEDLVMLAAERDSTEMFYSYHLNTKKAQKVLSRLPVLEEGLPRGLYTHESPLYQILKKRVRAHLKENKLPTQRHDWGRTATIMGSLAVLYVLTVFFALWWLTPLMGVMMAVAGLAIQHDGNHGSFSKDSKLNKWAGMVDELIGGSTLMWRHQHVVSHHAYTNDYEHDRDSVGAWPVIRNNPAMPWMFHMRFQFIYAPFVYSTIAIFYPIADTINLIMRKYQTVPLQPLRPGDLICFFVGKFVYAMLFLVIPYLVMGPDFLTMFYLPSMLVGGAYLGCLLLASHNTHINEFNVRTGDWAETMIRSTANWSNDSKLWYFFSGGLNFHIEHHLFPGISHANFPGIAPIIKQTCEEHGLPYHHFNGGWAIFISHLKLLYRLGKKPPEGSSLMKEDGQPVTF